MGNVQPPRPEENSHTKQHPYMIQFNPPICYVCMYMHTHTHIHPENHIYSKKTNKKDTDEHN